MIDRNEQTRAYPRTPQRIVIDLYDHTPGAEIADILDSLRAAGIDDARVERYVALGGGNAHTLDGWQPVAVEVEA